MEIIELFAVVFISILLGSVFFYGFGRRGPWGSFWSFLMIIFLGVLLFDVWTDPVGPVYYGVGWIDLLFMGLIFALILAASSPTDRPRKVSEQVAEENAAASVVAIGSFFWVLILLFLISIAVGIWMV